MKITETERQRVALMLIDDLAAQGELDSFRREPLLCRTFGRIYALTHTVNNPRCRKNHPQWLKQLDKEVLEFRRQRGKRGK